MVDDKFEELLLVDFSENIENINGFNYLSWAAAWTEFRSIFPKASYSVKLFSDKPYIYDQNLGYMVFTEVTNGDGETHEMWLPVLDFNFNWVKKHLIKSEIMLEYVDFIHVHNSGACIEVFKKHYFDEYLETCKHFEVEP